MRTKGSKNKTTKTVGKKELKPNRRDIELMDALVRLDVDNYVELNNKIKRVYLFILALSLATFFTTASLLVRIWSK